MKRASVLFAILAAGNGYNVAPACGDPCPVFVPQAQYMDLVYTVDPVYAVDPVSTAAVAPAYLPQPQIMAEFEQQPMMQSASSSQVGYGPPTHWDEYVYPLRTNKKRNYDVSALFQDDDNNNNNNNNNNLDNWGPWGGFPVQIR